MPRMTVTYKPAIQAPTSAKGVQAPSLAHLRKASDSRPNLAVAAANLSVQLAIVFLVFVVAGHELDVHLHTQPLWTAVGFALAITGMALVVWRQVRLVAPTITQADIDRAKQIRDQEEDEG